MKKILYIIPAVLLAFSCSFEDIQPQQSINASEAYGTSTDIDVALIGMYDRFQDGDVGGCNITLLSDLLEARNVNWSGSFTSYQDVFRKQMDAVNGEAVALWLDGYETILAANAILDALPNVEPGPGVDIEDYRNRARGEALAMRAIVHFEIVRYFGESPYVAETTPAQNTQLGIPIITSAEFNFEEIENPDNLPERATVGEVYQQVIADLEEAEGLGTVYNAPGFINVDVIRAYLLKVRMQQGEWAEVERLADLIIPNYALSPTLRAYFDDEAGNNQESIFQVLHNETDSPGVNGSLSTFYNSRGRNDIQITQAYLALVSDLFNARQTNEITTNNYTTTDQRYASNLVTADQTTNKYEDFVNVADNAPICRLAEILLSKAEALAEQNGVDQDAIDLLNQVRARSIEVFDDSGLPVTGAAAEAVINYEVADFANGQELLDAILLERRVELAFEGHAYHDAVRRGTVPPLGPNAVSYTFPIPQRELDNNSKLVQNPDYN